MGMMQNNNNSRFRQFMAWTKQHPVLMNVIYFLLACWVAAFIMLMFTDWWTNHGVEVKVPSVKGSSAELAAVTLRHNGFESEILDSIYDSERRPGEVIEQMPRAGALVKPGRMVYLTIVAFKPKMVTVPDFNSVSMRQGISMFEALGIEQVHTISVPSEYKDLVLGARYNGVPLRPGQRIPVTAVITLEIGSGYGDFEEDTDPSDTYFNEETDNDITLDIQ